MCLQKATSPERTMADLKPETNHPEANLALHLDLWNLFLVLAGVTALLVFIHR
jgi:hypothetical protein